MEFKSNAAIVGFGVYVPEKKLTNQDLEKMVDTTDEWIVQRTGISERRMAAEDEFASHMGVRAVQNLVADNGVQVDDVDTILVSTFTPDHFSPSVSALIQGQLGIRQAATVDLGAGCTGFVYGLWMADALITSGRAKKVLVIAAETTTKAADYSDRSTCILFGDAAAACLLEYTSGKGSFLGASFTSDGAMGQNVVARNLASCVNGEQIDHNRGIFWQNGKNVYKYMVRQVPLGVYRLLEEANLSLNDIDWFIPHSANLRMIEAICEKLHYPPEKMLNSQELYGNTSSATIPLAIWLALNRGLLQKGHRCLLYGFGGGLTHGGVVIEL